MNPLISVIIPVYNVEQYLDRCMQSIFAQTYTNLEIILVDDGSPDSCGAICDKYAQQDSRVVVVHKTNGGLSDARNAGLDIATGEYIGFVDSDDWIDEDMFQYLYEGILEHSADISVCGFYTVKSNTISATHREAARVYTREDAFKALLADQEIQNYAWNKLYKASLFGKNVRFPVGRHFEDVGTTYKLFLNAEKIVQLPESKYYYFRHPGSIVGAWKLHSLIDYAYCLQSRYEETIEEFPHFSASHFKKYARVLDIICEKLKKDSRAFTAKDCSALEETICPFIRMHYQAILDVSGKGRFWQHEIASLAKDCKRYIKTQPFKDKVYSAYQNICSIFRAPKKQLILHKQFKKHRIYKLFKSSKFGARIIIMDSANYDNLGDQAISYAQLLWLQQMFPNKHIIELFEPETRKFAHQIKRCLKKDDILVLQGGGNLGSLYMWAENIRRTVIKKFSKNRIVIFPQSLAGVENSELKKSQQIYSQHKNLYIVAREKLSYEKLKEYFPKNHILLTPDIAMTLHPQIKEARSGATLCLRKDAENTLTNADIYSIKSIVKQHFPIVKSTTTIADKWITSPDRKSALEEKWREFAGAEVVVTNRLHGMIFAAITGTPCIALDNATHKIKHSFDWLSHLNYIYYIDSIAELEVALANVTQTEDCTYDVASITDRFSELYRVLE